MTSTRNAVPNFILTPQQQNLLFAALNSQRPANGLTGVLTQSPPAFSNESPAQVSDGLPNAQESPYLDYDYDFGGDSTFDYSYDNVHNDKMIGDSASAPSVAKSDSAESDSPDKRGHPDDDDDEDVGTAKRREGEDKIAKKPGRKPLTTEPSSKRKAQNRAAQRAFRERKEKHLKDLETKVQELEKASETANHENEQLRTKVEKLTKELNEYKKRVSMVANNRTASLGRPAPFGVDAVNNINDVNFQFEFPKFGALPGPSPNTNGAKRSPSRTSTSTSSKRTNSDQVSPTEKSKVSFSPSISSTYSQVGLDSQTKEDLAHLSAGLFNSGMVNGPAVNERTSIESHFSAGGATNTSSPSASSNSNMGGPSSSCGTSPEPSTQSPTGFKPVDTMTTIEEQPSLISSGHDAGHFANIDVNGFNWLPQSDFQFDPQLFGDYRDPQDNVLPGGFDDSFFNEAFDTDFTTPYNVPAQGGEAPKKDLIAQIDAAKDADDSQSASQLLTCNKIWEELQNCPRVQSGDFDLDGLCSDLQKKAKCSGTGAVVDEKDFKRVMHKYLGKSGQELGSSLIAKASMA